VGAKKVGGGVGGEVGGSEKKGRWVHLPGPTLPPRSQGQNLSTSYLPGKKEDK
jgi:hypothetical protein